ncbi:MAG: kynureninase [Flavobacteriales bacterium]
MAFENSLEFAQSLDQSDRLAGYRDRFIFPQHNSTDVLYFTGNSLGLQPKATRDSVNQELEDWARYGVEGHFMARRPWYNYHEMFAEGSAKIVGGLPEEVVVMNQLTVNLHLMLISFYRPAGKRRKILFETKPFPSDHYAFESQARLHGLDPADVLVEMQPRHGELTLRTEDIVAKIHELGDELAMVCFGAVNYFTGQFFEISTITSAGHSVGAHVGFDLAHAAGNVPLYLHDQEVDFACWCSYKYLNSGPGGVSGVFVHKKHHANKDLVRLAGWWGHNKETRFQMQPGFDPIESAEAWQMSNAPVLSMAAHKAALDIFSEAGMNALREKSLNLTAYLEFIFQETALTTGVQLQIITPTVPTERGCQLSVIVPGATKQLVKDLAAQGVVVDWREPNVIRLAPVPLYNRFEDIYSFGKTLTGLLIK